LGRIALGPEEIRLTGGIGGDAGNLVDLGVIGARMGGVGGRGREDEIDLVAEDQLGGDLGGAAAARLAVLADNLNLVRATAALYALCQDAADLLEDESVSLAEAGERTRLRADVADLDDPALGIGGEEPGARPPPPHRRPRG